MNRFYRKPKPETMKKNRQLYLKEYKNADKIMKDGFLLGAHHGMTLEDVDKVCTLLKHFAISKIGRTDLLPTFLSKPGGKYFH